MPQCPFWTPACDARLRRLRAEGATWDEISADLGTTRDVARERGRKIGALRPPPDHAPNLDPDPDRPPLAPCSPRSWAVITNGTSLEGTICPWPPSEKEDAQ